MMVNYRCGGRLRYNEQGELEPYYVTLEELAKISPRFEIRGAISELCKHVPTRQQPLQVHHDELLRHRPEILMEPLKCTALCPSCHGRIIER